MAPDLNKNGTKRGFKILLLRGFELRLVRSGGRAQTDTPLNRI
jgi:hypothetical protein